MPATISNQLAVHPGSLTDCGSALPLPHCSTMTSSWAENCVVLAGAQGLLQLGFVFMQFSTVVFALSIVQLMQAALR